MYYIYWYSYFNLQDPSWTELSHFVKFFDTQLRACENSVYCSALAEDIQQGVVGFKSFVVNFMIKMSVVSYLHSNDYFSCHCTCYLRMSLL